MKILITGCNGMLGTDLCKVLQAAGFEVYGFDLKASKDKCLECKNFLKIDITDESATIDAIKKIKPDVIIHAAAMTDVDGCETDPDRANLINVTGTKNVSLGAKSAGAVIFFISTDYVFDGEKKEPYLEYDPTNPISVYGKTKLLGEQLVKEIVPNYSIIRTSWLYGRCGKNFVDTIRKKALYDKKLKVVIDQYGSPTYTMDLAGAISNLLEELSKGNEKIRGIFHITNSDNCSWCKFAEKILDYSFINDVEITPITSNELTRAAKRPKMSILENSRFREIFGRLPRPWNLALRDYIAGLDK